MYNQFFALRKDPFNLTPDPDFLYLAPQHREALAGLTYAILSRKGFVVLTGDAGTGKTTLLTRVLQHLSGTRDSIERHCKPDAHSRGIPGSRAVGFWHHGYSGKQGATHRTPSESPLGRAPGGQDFGVDR